MFSYSNWIKTFKQYVKNQLTSIQLLSTPDSPMEGVQIFQPSKPSHPSHTIPDVWDVFLPES